MILALSSFLALLCIALAAKDKKSEAPKILEMKGVVTLDSFNYHKFLPSKKYAAVFLIYQKGRVGDYGTDSIRSDYYAFAKKAQTDGEADNIIFAQLIVNGAENLKLAQRLGVKENFEHPVMVVVPKGKTSAIQYPSEAPFRLYELTVFLSKHTDFFLKQAGRTKLLNKLRKDFLAASSDEVKLQLIEDARSEANLITAAIEKQDTDYHIEILHSVLKEGVTALEKEIVSLQQRQTDPTLNVGDRRVALMKNDVLKELYEALAPPAVTRDDL